MWHKMHKCNDAHFELTATEAVKIKVGRREKKVK